MYSPARIDSRYHDPRGSLNPFHRPGGVYMSRFPQLRTPRRGVAGAARNRYPSERSSPRTRRNTAGSIQ